MKKIKLTLGRFSETPSGRIPIESSEVSFRGRLILSTLTNAIDSREAMYTLYHAEGDRFILYVYTNTLRELIEVTPEELSPTGKYAKIGDVIDFNMPPLSLEEALEYSKKLRELGR